jgi:hypothetical protein
LNPFERPARCDSFHGAHAGKLSLYVAAAGLQPARTLPITIDMGTNNKDLLEDPLYIGSKMERVDENVCVCGGGMRGGGNDKNVLETRFTLIPNRSLSMRMYRGDVGGFRNWPGVAALCVRVSHCECFVLDDPVWGYLSV